MYYESGAFLQGIHVSVKRLKRLLEKRRRLGAFLANSLYWKSFKRQNSIHLELLKHQNTKTALYKLLKNHWVIALFEISVSVRNNLLVTVSLDHPVAFRRLTHPTLSERGNFL